MMIRAFFNGKAPVWDELHSEKDSTKLGNIAQRLNIQVGYWLLDVGTGTGTLVPFLLDKIGMNGRLIAMDIAEEMLKISRAKKFSGNIDHLHADIGNLPLPEEIFDTVVCYSSFPHFRNKSQALVEIARVLKSGCTLFICHTSSRAKINAIHSGIPPVKNDFIPDTEEMRELLSNAGFGHIQIEDNDSSYLASSTKY
jgi:ubiquinone/menaquinone biosynthesis C-methylase UbiE